MFTNDINLPTEEELTVPEVLLGNATLIAAGNHLGLHCQTENDEFMLCRDEETDPRKCLKEGFAVTKCSIDFFSKVKMNCLKEFDRYSHCIDFGSWDYDLSRCRKTQTAFDLCAMEKMGIERASFGYFCRPRVLDTKRPKPVGYQAPDFPNKPQPPSEPTGRKPNPLGARKYWM